MKSIFSKFVHHFGLKKTKISKMTDEDLICKFLYDKYGKNSDNEQTKLLLSEFVAWIRKNEEDCNDENELYYIFLEKERGLVRGTEEIKEAVSELKKFISWCRYI